MSTVLRILIPQEFASCVFQLEFDCPDDYSYTTPILSPTTQQDKTVLQYQLESCILQCSGIVKVQMTIKDSATDAIIAKTTIDNRCVLEVMPSVNAQSQSYSKQDFFAQAYQVLNKIELDKQELEKLHAQVDNIKDGCDSFLAEYQAKLNSGELRGEQGATVASITESGKDLEGNSIYTIAMSDGGKFNFTVPAGKQGEKGDKGDKGDTSLTGEYITMVFFKQTLANGDREYIIGTNLGNEFSFISPKGTDGIDGEIITAVNHTSTDSDGNMSYVIVTNMGKEFSFTVPRGKQGEQGIQGEKGEKGDKGDTPVLEGTHESLTAGRAIADKNGNEIATIYATKTQTNSLSMCPTSVGVINYDTSIIKDGTTLTMPSNGYFTLYGNTTSTANILELIVSVDNVAIFQTRTQYKADANRIGLYVPVIKSSKVSIYFGSGITPTKVFFTPAVTV